jgi:hypothetical protein
MRSGKNLRKFNERAKMKFQSGVSRKLPLTRGAASYRIGIPARSVKAGFFIRRLPMQLEVRAGVRFGRTHKPFRIALS